MLRAPPSSRAPAGLHAPAQADDEWFQAAQDTPREKIAVEPVTTPAEHVIIPIADGDGVGTNHAARLLTGREAGDMGDEHALRHETFPYLALAKTYDVDARPPDPAGTGTAMHSAIKTMAPPLDPGPPFFVLTKRPTAVCPFCETEADRPDDILAVHTKRAPDRVAFDRPIEDGRAPEIGGHEDPDTGFLGHMRLRDATHGAAA